MNFIPVVGPLISGLFGGLWSAFSPLLAGGQQQSDPIQTLAYEMEKFVNQRITALENQMNANLKDKFRDVITKSIRGKNNRDGLVLQQKATEQVPLFLLLSSVPVDREIIISNEKFHFQIHLRQVR